VIPYPNAIFRLNGLCLQAEFEETILQDLKMLDIQSDLVSHTSDYFDKLYELACRLIQLGKAYADDTEQLQVRDSCLNLSFLLIS
jgi:glutamyl/glutaminyl-tRNA synthetase